MGNEDSIEGAYSSIISAYFRSKEAPLTIRNVSKHTKIPSKYVKIFVKSNPKMLSRVHPIECGNGKYMSLKNCDSIANGSIWILNNRCG